MSLGKLGKLVRVRMLTGKHAGLELALTDLILEPTDRIDVVRVNLPRLQGDGQILPDVPWNN